MCNIDIEFPYGLPWTIENCLTWLGLQEPEEGMQGRPMNQKSKHREKEESEKVTFDERSE